MSEVDDAGKIFDPSHGDGFNSNRVATKQSGTSSSSNIEIPINTDTKQSSGLKEESTSSPNNIDVTHLALVPLHPAANRRKLDAKQLPIVLGRTNLAAWWWKSCPCQHYCRLHCRPVAQNIRSLSKVMIQVDTAGRVHLVGKNPHLVTITPERDDNMLQVNDVISIGRRDREPWMRFQVVHKKPTDSHFDISYPTSNRRSATSKARAPPLEWVQPLSTAPLAHETSVLASAMPTESTAAPPAIDNQNIRLERATNVPNKNNPSNPPEWITTNTRKRKSGRTSNSSVTMSNKSHGHNNLTHLSRRQNESRSATTNSRIQRPFDRTSHRADSQANAQPEQGRKRRRQTVDARASGPPARKSSRRTNRYDSFEKTSGCTNSTTNTEHNKRDHPHVHLVFQDYQTSAILLQDNELVRKSESSMNQATAITTKSNVDSPQRQGGDTLSARVFVAADKSQLRLLSRNFAAALLGAVSPPTEDKVSTSQPESPHQDATQNQELKDEAMESKVIPSTRNRLLLPSSEECENCLPVFDTISKHPLDELVRPKDPETRQQETKEKEADEPLILSLPECASSSFEAGQKDFVSEPFHTVDYEKRHLTGLLFAAPKKGNEDIGDDSASSPPSCDPIMDLKPWQDMIEEEEEKGNVSSFRHALASLIVAKNQDHLGDDGKRGLLWLPPLLGEDFEIERKRSPKSS